MASDDFTDSDGTGLEVHDSKWESAGGTYAVTQLEINNNLVEREAAWGNHGACYVDGQSEDQSSQILVKAHSTSTANKHCGVRMQTDGGGLGYSITMGAASGGNWTRFDFYKDGAFLQGGSTGSWPQASDYTLYISATQNGANVDLVGRVNGADESTHTDTSTVLRNGYPGFWGIAVASVSETRYDDWTDGIGGAAGVTGIPIGNTQLNRRLSGRRI